MGGKGDKSRRGTRLGCQDRAKSCEVGSLGEEILHEHLELCDPLVGKLQGNRQSFHPVRCLHALEKEGHIGRIGSRRVQIVDSDINDLYARRFQISDRADEIAVASDSPVRARAKPYGERYGMSGTKFDHGFVWEISRRCA